MATITGTTASNTLRGTELADQIFGLAGNDTLIGYGGDDVLEGGAGADQLFGSSGFDLASYLSSPAGVQVSLLISYAAGGHTAGDSLYGIEDLRGSAFADGLFGDDQRNVIYGEGGNDELGGFGGNDRLYGGGGNDLLRGGDGADRLEGGSGNDVLDGGSGNDELRGGAGTDTARFTGNNVLVSLQEGFATGGETDGGLIGTDRLFGIENVIGTRGADLIAGDSNANVLTGGLGLDSLVGGGGADRFAYSLTADSPYAAADEIVDFSRVQGDRIDLAAVDANEQLSGNQAFQFIGTAAFTGAGQLRYYHYDGHTFLEANTTDAAPCSERRIVIDALIAHQASDFLL